MKKQQNAAWYIQVIDVAADVIFMVDIISNFNTGYALTLAYIFLTEALAYKGHDNVHLDFHLCGYFFSCCYQLCAIHRRGPHYRSTKYCKELSDGVVLHRCEFES